MPGSTPTLRDMVQDAFDRGLTLEQLEARAVDPQTQQKASRALISRLRRGEVDRMPYDYHVRAIAAAIGKSYDEVRRAAIAQWLPAEDGANTEEELLSEVRRMREAAERLEKRVGEPGEKDAASESA